MDLQVHRGSFVITKATIITYQAECKCIATYLAGFLARTARIPLGTRLVSPAKATLNNAIELCLLESRQDIPEEGYVLAATANGIRIAGVDPAGCFRGVQTLRQLLPAAIEGAIVPDGISLQVPLVTIKDFPRFRWRGFMLDECRHFFGKVLAKRMIDIIALLKFNKLHWHLTDDEGWRIESRKFPKLHEIASSRPLSKHWKESPNLSDPKWYGGYYTQDEIKEVIEYAREHFIEIIPEIEMPGHATAPLVAYPEYGCATPPATVPIVDQGNRHAYCAGKQETYQFLKDVLGEVKELFGGDKIHIGGDELPAERWMACPRCQAFMKEKGFPDLDMLQVHFAAEFAKYLASRDCTSIGWFDFPVDRLLDQGVDPAKLIFQFWTGSEQKLVDFVRRGGKAIVSNHEYMYLDYHHWQISLEKAYNFDPIPSDLDAQNHQNILGLECPIWTERVPNWQRMDFQVFPRALAYAETGWSSRSLRSYPDFLERLKTFLPRLDALCVYYAPLDEATNSSK